LRESERRVGRGGRDMENKTIAPKGMTCDQWLGFCAALKLANDKQLALMKKKVTERIELRERINKVVVTS
jgi:hypothetical protein